MREVVGYLVEQMEQASGALEFERAARVRDQIKRLATGATRTEREWRRRRL